MEIIKAYYHDEPPRVTFDSGAQNHTTPQTLAELFSNVSLNERNIKIPHEEIMSLKLSETNDTVFIEPDTPETAAHGPIMVQDFNEKMRFYYDLNPEHVIALIAIARRRLDEED